MKNQLKSGGTGSRSNPVQNPAEERLQARNRLQERGIAADEERLFKYVATGDAETVKLLLAAGISSQARSADGTEAVVIAAQSGHQEVVSLLLAQGARTATLVEALQSAKKSRKDRWDKLTSLSSVLTFTSTLLIATVGGAYTYLQNRRQTELLELQQSRDLALKQEQNRVIELQTVEKMIPHLVANEQQKRAALIAISALSSPELAARMGQAFGGQGAVQALESIATTSQGGAPAAVSALTALAANTQTSADVQSALGSIFRAKQNALVSIFVDGDPNCSGFVADADKGLVVTTDYCLDPRLGKTFEVRTLSGQKLQTTSHRRWTERGMGVLKISERLPSLTLSTRSVTAGERMVTLGAFPAIQEGELVGLVGVVQSVETAGSDPINPALTSKQFLHLEFFERGKTRGTAGGPILDAQGEVVCMTYSADVQSESCLSSQSIARALQSP